MAAITKNRGLRRQNWAAIWAALGLEPACVVIDLCTEVTYIPNKTSGTEKEKCAENVVQQLVCIESNGGINGVYGQTTREQFAIIKL